MRWGGYQIARPGLGGSLYREINSLEMRKSFSRYTRGQSGSLEEGFSLKEDIVMRDWSAQLGPARLSSANIILIQATAGELRAVF